MCNNKNTDSTDELRIRYEISREVFERPLEMTKHEDEKAGRILASVAFLTVAATSVFSTFQNKGLKFELSLCSQRIDLIFLSFAGYVIFVILGTILMLEALGPSFEFPKIWQTSVKPQGKSDNETYEPRSIFFFEKISEEKRDQWANYFGGNINEILNKACNDHVYEAHLVSTKVRKKIRCIKWGKYCFYAAMILFIALMLFGFYVYTIKQP